MPACSRCGREHDGPCPTMLAAGGDMPTQLAVTQQAIGDAPPLDAGDDAAVGDLAPGSMVGEYAVEDRIGVGGMGVVYSGRHPLIGRRVAIKVLNAVASAADGAAGRFLQEARAASLVRHRNIVDVFAFGQLVDGRYYLVMEFLDGETLHAWLNAHGPLSLRQAMPIIDGMLAGLKQAHEHGIVHRDLKPENVWICKPDEDAPPGDAEVDPLRVKILDFGLAKLSADTGAAVMVTRAGAPIGTPTFMSPEQCRGLGPVDARSDIYSLGVILYEMFSGLLPFVGMSAVEVMSQQISTRAPALAQRIGLPDDLDDVIGRCLEKDPSDRFQTVADLRAALVACDEATWAWEPPRAVPDASSPGVIADAGAATIAPGAPGTVVDAPEAPRVPRFADAACTVEPTLARGTLTLAFRGELDGDPAQLGAWLSHVTEALDGVERVVLDVVELAWCGSDAVAYLTDWLSFLRELRAEGLAPTTVRFAEAVQWQRATVPLLQRVDPALMLESAD